MGSRYVASSNQALASGPHGIDPVVMDHAAPRAANRPATVTRKAGNPQRAIHHPCPAPNRAPTATAHAAASGRGTPLCERRAATSDPSAATDPMDRSIDPAATTIPAPRLAVKRIAASSRSTDTARGPRNPSWRPKPVAKRATRRTQGARDPVTTCSECGEVGTSGGRRSRRPARATPSATERRPIGYPPHGG